MSETMEFTRWCGMNEYVSKDSVYEIYDVIRRRLLKIPESNVNRARLMGAKSVCDIVRHLPAADVVEVCLCKNCVFYAPYFVGVDMRKDGVCGAPWLAERMSVSEDHYCSWAQPKDNEDEGKKHD